MALWHHYVAFFHLIVLFHHTIVIHYDFIYIAPIEASVRSFSFGGRLIYLSVWNMFIQLIYFAMAFVNDFIESKDTHTSSYRSQFSQLKNYVFTALAFPLALNVGAIFWLLFFIDRDLVTSRELQELIPMWFTHMMRTNIMVFVVIEMVCASRRYGRHLWALVGLLTVLCCYIAWTILVYLITDNWVHPIFENFNWPQRVGFYGFNILVPVTFYFIGDLVNSQLLGRWGSEAKGMQRKRSNRASKPDLISENIERSSEV